MPCEAIYKRLKRDSTPEGNVPLNPDTSVSGLSSMRTEGELLSANATTATSLPANGYVRERVPQKTHGPLVVVKFGVKSASDIIGYIDGMLGIGLVVQGTGMS